MHKIIYSKCSNERAPEFSIRTMIFEDCSGKRAVQKIPDTSAAEAHIKKIYNWYIELSEQFKSTGICINKCELTNTGICFEYLKGQTLETLLDGYIEQNDRKHFVELVEKYIAILVDVHKSSNFHMTEQFERIFGRAEINEHENCGDITNIDALFSNILITKNDRWYMLDYEWTFDFPIPIKFLIYRIFFYYCHEHEKRNIVKEWVSLEQFGITPELERTFEQMEIGFQKYIQGKRIPIRNMFDLISPGTIRLDEMQYLGKNRIMSQKVQIYETANENITEQDSYYLSMDAENYFEKSFLVPPKINYFRIDPCSRRCLVKNLKIQCDNVDCSYNTNGVLVAENSLFFETSDPYFLINEPKKYINKKISVSFRVEFIEKKTAETILSYRNRNNQLEISLDQADVCIKQQTDYAEELLRHIRQLEEGIDQLETNCKELDAALAVELTENAVLKDKINVMENTKVWKVYQKYKSIRHES